MMDNLLDETVATLIYKGIDNRTLSLVSETLRNNVSKWNEPLRKLLDLSLVRKILQNETYWYGSVNEQLLKTNFDEGRTEDLAFIWLFTLRKKMESEVE